MAEFKTFLVSYRHGGSEWNIELPAQDYADARERLSQLALGRIEGVSVAKIPEVFGIFAAVAAFIRNAVR